MSNSYSNFLKRLFLTLLLLLPNLAFAEDQDRGRLPDGRAFRTDIEGTQVVDYIAELELTILELNRRVAVLEDENNDLRNTKVGSGQPSGLKEKTIFESAEARGSLDLNDSKLRLVESLKSSVEANLNSILATKDERDVLLNQHKDKYPQLLTVLSPQISKNGNNLVQIEQKIKESREPMELAILRVELEEISRQTSADLALIAKIVSNRP